VLATAISEPKQENHLNKKLRLAYVVSHPIQYQAPLLRRLAQEPDIDLTVFFFSDHSVKGYADVGFGGVQVKWDIPLLDGYRYEFLPIVRHLKGKKTFWAPFNRGFHRAFKKGKFDAVWLHGYWSINSILTMIAAKLLGIPVLVRVDNTLTEHPRSNFRLAIKRLFFSIVRHFIHAVLPVSSMNRDYWAHYLGPDFPLFMVPYAVDNKYFQSATAIASNWREEFRQQLNLERDRPVILFASKLLVRKRCIDLIDAYLGIKLTPGSKRPYLLIVGDGSERAACEAKIRAAGEADVHFLGFQNQSQLAQFYDLCDVFVLPSARDSFALTVNEVMNAKVFPARNVEALRAAIVSVLGDDKGRLEMGQRSLERINQWSFEEDIRGLRQALHYVAGLPLSPIQGIESIAPSDTTGSWVTTPISDHL
jgi:glycosyltransferase involved in cell wall biosynthesis